MKLKPIVLLSIFAIALPVQAGFFSSAKTEPCVTMAAAVASQVKMDCRENGDEEACKILGKITAKDRSAQACQEIGKKYKTMTSHRGVASEPEDSNDEEVKTAIAPSEDEDAG
ncbi:MAG: hypothetical protein H7061_10280 [Bdellovibrionaceae bacterium]|nr:hypothetical protein [Bdellovibrio sp.]